MQLAIAKWLVAVKVSTSFFMLINLMQQILYEVTQFQFQF